MDVNGGSYTLPAGRGSPVDGLGGGGAEDDVVQLRRAAQDADLEEDRLHEARLEPAEHGEPVHRRVAGAHRPVAAGEEIISLMLLKL